LPLSVCRLEVEEENILENHSPRYLFNKSENR
jgi:hypothetical protein